MLLFFLQMPVQAAEVFDELTAFDDLTVLNTEEKPVSWLNI